MLDYRQDPDPDETERPRCPNCGMRMITNAERSPRTFECLRCGHIEEAQLQSGCPYELVN